MTETIVDRFEQINKRIHKACIDAGRNPDEILLVAVSKTKPNRDIIELAARGQIHFGENRARELENKMKEIDKPSIQWHFIGNLQTNKIKYIAGRVDWIQSVHKKKALKEIEKRAAEEQRTIRALIQVNISEEDQKSGCEPAQLQEILTYAQTLKYTKVLGLMGMATFTDNPENVRHEFRKLRELKEAHEHMNQEGVELQHLSMGMTNDLEVAIQEGATMLRIGTAIFGERNY